MKMTIEQLLFAHRIGATHYDTSECMFITSKQWYNSDNGEWNNHDVTLSPVRDIEIDFSPLYDWIEHDGGECPVRGSDIVKIVVDGEIINDWFLAGRGDWRNVQQFKLQQPEDWPEQRSDAIGQNGNDGAPYAGVKAEAAVKAYTDVQSYIDEQTVKRSKYHREIAPGVWVDVYDVLKAWQVTCPALQHLINKALQPGERGHKTLDQDMKDIVASAIRAQEMAKDA